MVSVERIRFFHNQIVEEATSWRDANDILRKEAIQLQKEQTFPISFEVLFSNGESHIGVYKVSVNDVVFANLHAHILGFVEFMMGNSRPDNMPETLYKVLIAFDREEWSSFYYQTLLPSCGEEQVSWQHDQRIALLASILQQGKWETSFLPPNHELYKAEKERYFLTEAGTAFYRANQFEIRKLIRQNMQIRAAKRA